MPRYIDADNLIADFESVGGEFDVDGIKYIINTYHKPADVVPVVRGEWIEKTYMHECANEEAEERQYVVCGICGKQPPSGFGAVNFCHNCGANMEGKPCG